MIEGVRLVQWNVPDLELATRWYSRVLDTEPWLCDDDRTTFDSCGIWLELRRSPLRLQGAVETPAGYVTLPSDPILYLGVEDLQSAWVRLLSEGVVLRAAEPGPYPDTKAALFEDPFGRTLGLMERNDAQVLRARQQRIAEKVALRHVRSKLDDLAQEEANKQRTLRVLGRIAVVLALIVIGITLYRVRTAAAPQPTVNVKELMQQR